MCQTGEEKVISMQFRIESDFGCLRDGHQVWPHLVDEHDDDVLLREEGVKTEGAGGGVESAAHVGHSRPAHARVQDVAVQLRVYLRLQHEK